MRRHKYGAVKTAVGDLVFASKLEARGYEELLLLEKGGVIKDLELQKAFVINVNGKHVCSYICDYFFTKCVNGKEVVAEAKGVATADYRIKIKLMKALYPAYEYFMYRGNKWSGGSFYN